MRRCVSACLRKVPDDLDQPKTNYENETEENDQRGQNILYSRIDKSHVAIRAVSAPLHDGMNACGGNGNFASDVIWVGQSAVCAYTFRHCLVLTITFAQYHPQRFSYLYARTIRSHNGGLGALLS